MKSRIPKKSVPSLTVLVAVIALGAIALEPSFLGRMSYWSYEDSVQRTSGTFYRVTSKYTIDGKEPMTFDVVVACNALIRNYKDGDRSVERHFTPNFVAKRTEAGHALMLAVPELCGITDVLDKRVGSNPFPTVIWFEDAEDLTLGTAYYSEDADVNPNSRLSFDGIEIAEATRADWDAWIETRPENLVTREMVQSLAWHHERVKQRLQRLPKTFARTCHGVGRVKLPSVVREKIRKFWPSDRPRYWTVDHSKAFDDVDFALHGDRGRGDPNTPLFGDYPLSQYWFGGPRGDGQLVPTRELGHALHHLANKYPGSSYRYYPAEYFPLYDPRGVPFWRSDTKEKSELVADVRLDGDRNKGFLACYFGRSPNVPPTNIQKIGLSLRRCQRKREGKIHPKPYVRL